MNKLLYNIGIGGWVIMFIFSIIFFKERTIFLDMAFNLFYIIKNCSFSIEIYRFGDLITQILPIIGCKLGFPLNGILQLYSVSFVLYSFIGYFICGTILKRYDFALLILLLNILFAAHTFFWMQSQLPRAIAILMVIFAFISNKQLISIGYLAQGIVILALITIVFFHPLVIFVMMFSLLFFSMSSSPVIDKKLIYVISIVYMVCMFLKIFVFKTTTVRLIYSVV